MSPAERVAAAWNNPGRAPGHHRRMQAQLRREWPTLAAAVEDLAAATPVRASEPMSAEYEARARERQERRLRLKAALEERGLR